jgi:hypothetical protein
MALYEDIFLKEFQYPFYNISSECICALTLVLPFGDLYD